MNLYAELAGVRKQQMTKDAVAIAAALASIILGVVLYRLVALAAAPGETIENAGDAVGSVPGLGGAGAALAEAGRSQQDAVLTVAFWVGLLAAVVGVATVLVLYLPGRLAWAREAATAARLRDSTMDLRLLAYRAVARRPLSRLQQAVDDPGAALDEGRYAPLANLELEELGLRPAG